MGGVLYCSLSCAILGFSMHERGLTHAHIEANAIAFSMGISAVSLVLFLLLTEFAGLRFETTAIFGITGAVSVAIVIGMGFIAGYTRQFYPVATRLKRFKFYVDMIFLAISHAAVAFLLAAAIASAAAQYVPEIVVSTLIMSSFLSFMLGACAYAVYSHAAFMNANKLAGLFSIFIAAGALASMLTARDTSWLQHHFSALGAGESVSSYTFNLTMIIAGFIMVALADYIVMELEQIKRLQQFGKRIRMNFLRVVFTIIGVASVGVGVFPYDRFLEVHNIFANTLTIVFIILILSIPWTVPMFSTAFIIQSFVLVLLVLAVYVQFFTGNLNIFIIELVDGLLIFMWLIMFSRQIAALRMDQYAHAAHNSAQ